MSQSSPKVSGHPAMANILKLAEHRSKLKQNHQKMQHELLKMNAHSKKTTLDIKRMKAQSEYDQTSAATQMKLMKAKSKTKAEAHEMRKQHLDLDHQSKKKDLSLQQLSKKKDLDWQKKNLDLEKKRLALKKSSTRKKSTLSPSNQKVNTASKKSPARTRR